MAESCQSQNTDYYLYIFIHDTTRDTPDQLQLTWWQIIFAAIGVNYFLIFKYTLKIKPSSRSMSYAGNMSVVGGFLYKGGF
jgi:hypothetical protein